MATIKPTLKDPISPQSEKFEKDFRKTMVRSGLPQIRETGSLNEVDGLLTEKEQSLKKKIFSLAKMEALVFADPKLSAVYEDMAENGEEKYGYHYNETIQNMIFNDYVFNSPTYLQKYKMAIPKEKKRRDKSGINKLKKAGAEKMAQTGLPKQKTVSEEIDNEVTKVVFLVSEQDPKDPDLFAYFPEEIHNGEFRTVYSHIGQHSSAHPNYAKESRQATPEEYADLKAELEGIGYNLEVLNGMQESTSAGSAGGAAGYVGYAGPSAFSKKGDLSGDFKKNNRGNTGVAKPINKPISKVISISESKKNYITDPTPFKQYFEALNESSSISQGDGSGYYDTPLGFKDDVKNVSKQLDTDKELKDLDTVRTVMPGQENRAYGKHLPSGKNVSSAVAKPIPNNEIKKPFYEGGKVTSPFKVGGEKVSGSIIAKHSQPETMNEGYNPDMYSTEEDYKRLVQITKEKTGKGITKDHIPMLAGQALYNLAIKLAGQLLPFGWDDLPDINSMWDYIDENGGMTYDNLVAAVKEAVNDRLSEEGMGLDDLNEKAKSKAQQQFMGMVNAYKGGELSADDVSADIERAADSMSDKEVHDFASTKHKGLPDHVDETMGQPDIDYLVKGYEIINSGPNYDPAKAELFRSNLLQMDDAQAQQVSRTLDDMLRKMGYQNPQDVMNHQTNFNEDTQTMIQNNGTSMSNKAQATGDMSSEVPMGAQQTSGLNEEALSKERRFEMIKRIQDVAFNGSGGIPSADYLNKLSDEKLMKAFDNALKQDPAVKDKISSMFGLNESDIKLLEDINKELEAFSIHHDKLKLMSEDKKTTSQILNKRVTDENPKNFKKDFKDSDTKDVIDVEKELMWKDQQTDVGTDPQKLGADIEKAEIKTADMKSNEALKNVGDSTNNDGDEVPKRNLTTKEQEEVNLYRNGQHSLNYDNDPGERFVERMKADQGEFFEMGEKQKEFRKGAPSYNKDNTFVEDAQVDKMQFDKNVKEKGDKVAWNERMGLGSNVKLAESMVTGRYIDILGKRRLMEFRMGEVKEVKTLEEGTMQLNFDGLGNTYMNKTIDKKVVVNEGVVSIMESYKFYTDGKDIFSVKNPVQSLNESEVKEKPVVNEQMDKMKHLLGYKPEAYVDTKNVKKNRKF